MLETAIASVIRRGSSTSVMDRTRAKVLRRARAGKPKPSRFKTDKEWQMANFVYMTTNPKNPTYEPDFDRLIRRLRPDWFEKPEERNRKALAQTLVEDATLGFDRPRNLLELLWKAGHSIGRAVRKLRPDWFINFKLEARRKAQKKSVLNKLRRGVEISHADRQRLYVWRQPGSRFYDPVFSMIAERYRPVQRKEARR